MSALPGGVRRFFGIDADWVRPVPVRRVVAGDVLVAAVYGVCAVLSLETARSLGSLAEVEVSRTAQWVWIALPAVSLVVRRLMPITVALFAAAHLSFTALWEPTLSPVFAAQVYYFFALFTAIAWARDRRRLVGATAVFVAVVLGWIVYDLTARDGLETLGLLPQLGWFDATEAAVLQILLSTAVFLAAALLGGSLNWWSAQREAEARGLARTIAEQGEQLREKALGEERLRVARELHDVVGHHLAVIGIHSGVARRKLTRDPEEATTAMLQVEGSARDATVDLRRLLEALRMNETTTKAGDSGPHPVDRALRSTVAGFDTLDLDVELELCGDTDRVPAAVGLALDRIVKESVTNVTRHSTADRVQVTVAVRTDDTPSRAEVRVADNGRPRGGTSGSSVGIVGMQERAALHGGTVTTSTGPDGGFVVDATLTWSEGER
ncbi:histidine kinase [Nocardioides zeae]|uniref:histidine kinase n=1 Tax=Nocardioides imazamoxiresistens TaxID=3231893 RepID=A0ABU3PV74_9ACTN|nr:histidine kinase [Nocardioides zeae]MDT9593139.1 histidine kinase [Nocardioides zeae]